MHGDANKSCDLRFKIASCTGNWADIMTICRIHNKHVIFFDVNAWVCVAASWSSVASSVCSAFLLSHF
jgi:hypothetical protein